MTLAEIKAAHAQGQTVHWMNDGYTITGKDPENLSITFLNNKHSIGLTHRDGTTLNGKESEFYVSPDTQTV